MPDADRYAIDRALYKAVPYGAYSELAKFRGIKVNNISKYYDPHNPAYQSTFSRSLVELEVIGRVCPEWGRNILSVFNRFGAEWMGREAPTEHFNSGLESIVTLAARLQNPLTQDSDKMPLALELQRQVDAIVAGLRFEDREDSPEEGKGKVAIFAEARG